MKTSSFCSSALSAEPPPRKARAAAAYFATGRRPKAAANSSRASLEKQRVRPGAASKRFRHNHLVWEPCIYFGNPVWAQRCWECGDWPFQGWLEHNFLNSYGP